MSNASHLAGRRALVTGAASGIGLAVARHLGERGATVILSDLPGDGLARAAASIPGALSIPADLFQRSQVHHLADGAGDVDILVNNAGLQHVSPIEEFDEQRWDLLVGVMLTAPFLLCKRLLPGMYARDFGRIINIASVHGLVASPFKSAYISAKHGIVGFTKTVALEAATHSSNVTAHAICPSYVRTPLVENQIAAQARTHGIAADQVLDKVMLTSNAIRQLIEPDDVAGAVEFLCGPSAWSMTGSVLTMDAGWLAH
ncbi:MAG TPA: 3-hydroxybutyrate dehydrogenase [Candidatus Dormibacteraeota bacterium]|nr:3-hydroxybutyrate dehydrogenase [Candidatus Dormibacteraeota bacterium]